MIYLHPLCTSLHSLLDNIAFVIFTHHRLYFCFYHCSVLCIQSLFTLINTDKTTLAFFLHICLLSFHQCLSPFISSCLLLSLFALLYAASDFNINLGYITNQSFCISSVFLTMFAVSHFLWSSQSISLSRLVHHLVFFLSVCLHVHIFG